MESVVMYGKTLHVWEDCPLIGSLSYMQSLPRHSKPAYVWEYFSHMGKFAIDGKSSHIREDFPYLGTRVHVLEIFEFRESLPINWHAQFTPTARRRPSRRPACLHSKTETKQICVYMFISYPNILGYSIILGYPNIVGYSSILEYSNIGVQLEYPNVMWVYAMWVYASILGHSKGGPVYWDNPMVVQYSGVPPYTRALQSYCNILGYISVVSTALLLRGRGHGDDIHTCTLR
jgi:hypothetical protein